MIIVPLAVVVTFFAGEALVGAGRGTDWAIIVTLDDAAVAAEGFLVEVEELLWAVVGTVVDGFDLELEAAKAHVDIGAPAVGIAIRFGLLDGNGTGVDGQAETGDSSILISFDLHAAEGCGELYVLAIAVLVFIKVAAGDAGEREDECGDDYFLLHDLPPVPVMLNLVNALQDTRSTHKLFRGRGCKSGGHPHIRRIWPNCSDSLLLARK